MPSKCIFCKIITKSAPADIKFENENIIIFKDIKPAAQHHYLSVPKEHLKNVNSLSKNDHKDLLDEMISEGKRIVEQEGGDTNDLRIGFHLPPFNTVDHLHLHTISPASSMSLLHRVMFQPNSWWFTTVETIQERLANLDVATTKDNSKL
ncbi:histidine triad nucleotide-binding protein 3-like [Sitophilus oryzae]|uniref:Adenosine 5'-monophosphoramidase HINT3 n=1 Tax=Sitophilus oryzae TaxID=7048 RepID=A0A6J2XQS9_SITOR|nr:histidine triad nucleotide-binding protein 3-like [Sitophilus oryzae]XP_030753738.1 histidine triad nucleotide-binding protein 3-like [Sitophilus oryzae]